MLLVRGADLAHRAGDVVRVDLEAADETVRVIAERPAHHLSAQSDQADVDPPLVHLGERDVDGIVALLEPVGDVLEHVLGGHLHLAAARVAQHRPQVVVGAGVVGDREADHQVDRSDVRRHGHLVLLCER